MAKRNDNTKAGETSATVGYEAQLWQMADALRRSMDAAEYKHVVLGLIFLKYISDAFEEQHPKLVADKKSGPDPEDDRHVCGALIQLPRSQFDSQLAISGCRSGGGESAASSAGEG